MPFCNPNKAISHRLFDAVKAYNAEKNAKRKSASSYNIYINTYIYTDVSTNEYRTMTANNYASILPSSRRLC